MNFSAYLGIVEWIVVASVALVHLALSLIKVVDGDEIGLFSGLAHREGAVLVLGCNLQLILVQDAVEVGSKVNLMSRLPDISTAMCQIMTADEP